MRLDYALYGLAIILFATTAVTFALIADKDGKILYAISTTAVGVLSILGGFLMRPKVNEVSTVPPPPPAQPLGSGTDVGAPSAVLVPEASGSNVSASVGTVSKVETSLAEAPTTSLVKKDPLVSQMATASENSQVLVATSPSSVDFSITSEPANMKSELTKIRGISEKRVVQLKANGITSVEALANASVEDLAAKLDVSPKIIKMWIGSAKKLLK